MYLGKAHDQITVPIIDLVAALVKEDEPLVSLCRIRPLAGSFQRRVAKSTTCLAARRAPRTERRE